MIPTVVKGSGFRGLMNYLLVGRHNAAIVAGNMVGRSALELTREFGVCRRLRPTPQKPVMHHVLSFSDGEDPGDVIIARAAERYIQRMGLEPHQWVAVIHRDKAHTHVHLAINRIGLDGQWWNATHDFERSQVIAAQVEVEFGFVLVPRLRLQAAIRKAITENAIRPPDVAPPTPKPQKDIKHVLDQIRGLLEAIPHGLTAPEWVQAAEAQGLHLKPSIGGEKISGFTVTLSGHRAVKLSDIHRSLSWTKLTASGRVRYDPNTHFDMIAKLKTKELENDPSTDPALTTQFIPRDPDRTFNPRYGLWTWEWQPVQSRVVDTKVDFGPAPNPSVTSPPQATRIEDFRPPETSKFDPTAPRRSGATQSTGAELPAERISGHDESVRPIPEVLDIELIPSAPNRSSEHLLGGHSEFGSGGGPQGDFGIDASRANARPERSTDPTKAVGGLAQPVRGSVDRGGIPLGTRDVGKAHQWSDLGWSGLPRNARDLIGTQVDFEDLHLPQSRIPAEIHTAAKVVIGKEAHHRLPAREMDKRVLGRETLWEEAEKATLTSNQYRQAKAAVLAAQHQLEPARAIIRELIRMAMSGAMTLEVPDVESGRYPEPASGKSRPSPSASSESPPQDLFRPVRRKPKR